MKFNIPDKDTFMRETILLVFKNPSGLDYISWLDRYTCDDPLTRSGYVYQYDQATGAWGLWPCIVNPNNVQLNGPTPIGWNQ